MAIKLPFSSILLANDEDWLLRKGFVTFYTDLCSTNPVKAAASDPFIGAIANNGTAVSEALLNTHFLIKT